MLVLYPNDWFDVNKIGIIVIILCAVLVLFLSQPWWLTVLVELLLMLIIYYLIIKIRYYENTILLINNENQWVLKLDQMKFEIEIKDYWVLTGFIFLQLKGSNKSLSIVLYRRIIGARKFSQIRAKTL